jgi:alkylation response protein AidB-like acyl-CoA dehydrogenase
MDFEDSESQRLIRNTVREYLSAHYPWQRLFAVEAGNDDITSAELRKLGRLGWLGMAGSEDASLLDVGAVVEEFGQAATPSPTVAANVCSYVLARCTGDLAGRLLAGLSDGATVITMSDYRPRASQAPMPNAIALADGHVTGELPLVPFAKKADYALAWCDNAGSRALAALPLASASHEPARLLNSRHHYNVRFDNVPMEGSALLAQGDDARDLEEQAQALSTALYLVEMAGLMRRMTAMTAEYISNRVQFGQPIAKFQKARHRSADMWMHSETVRWAAYDALWRFQNDQDDTMAIWLTKHAAIRAADLLFHNAHILHGGIGVGIEHPLHLYSQAILELAVRGGTMPEMIERTGGGMGAAA